MSKDNAYLADILKAARAIRAFVAGVTKEQFLNNEEKYEAVNRKLEIIGEAARHLSPEARRQFPNVPWQLITAMRNILIHDYDDVDLNVFWNTAQDDLPPLIAQIETYLASHPPDTKPRRNKAKDLWTNIWFSEMITYRHHLPPYLLSHRLARQRKLRTGQRQCDCPAESLLNDRRFGNSKARPSGKARCA